MLHLRNRMSGFLAVVLLSGVLTVQSDDERKKENVGTVIGIDLGTTYSWLVVLLVVDFFLYLLLQEIAFAIIYFIMYFWPHFCNELSVTGCCYLVMCNLILLL